MPAAKKDEQLVIENEEQAQNLPEVAASNALVDSDGFDWEADAGVGMEGADADSFAIPFLRVIQKMSPQVDEHASEYMPDAKPGMLLNTVTGKLYDGKVGLDILPVSYQRRYLRWGPRGGDGAGYKGEYMPEEIDVMIKSGEIKELDGRLYAPLPDGTIDDKKCDRFSDTRSHFVIMMDPDGGLTQALMALTSTQIKKSKKLMSMLKNVVVNGKNPPTWMNIIHLTTVGESNDQGSWSGVRFEANGLVQSKALYNAGRDFHNALMAGEVAADYSKVEGEAEATGSGF